MNDEVKSPCISVCRMHAGSGWCEGCLRTIDEIAVWSMLDNAEKREVCVELGRRRVVWRRLQAAAGAVDGVEGVA